MRLRNRWYSRPRLLLPLPPARRGPRRCRVDWRRARCWAGVNLPLGGRFLTPATPLVSDGETVSYEQKIGEPADEGFSIGVWASCEGTVSLQDEDIVAISGGAVPAGEAQAEERAEAAR